MENIRFGKLNATDEECIEAAKQTDVIELLDRENDNNNINENEKTKTKYGLMDYLEEKDKRFL